MEIRPVRPGEYDELGAITLAAYESLGRAVPDAYAAELRDVARRAVEAVVLAAVDGAELLGGVTYVPDASSPYAEDLADGEAGIRMLAVAPGAQGRGAGGRLVDACIERAVTDGRRRLCLHSTSWMTTAHGIYERRGFVREPERDWPIDDVVLLAYALDLRSPAGGTVRSSPGGETGSTREA